MALALAAFIFLALCGFCLGFASLGNLILRILHLEMPSDSEHLLVAIALGLLITEILVFPVQLSAYIRQGSVAIVVLLCAFLLLEWNSVWARMRRALRLIAPTSPFSKFLLVLLAIVVCVQFLAAMAPLTGSDALHYHFTVQKQILEHGFHPNFSISHSLLCGQHHLLILFGLALGSEQLALGFIFLGGLLTTASMACLISRWASATVVAAFSLLFLLTPVVFWQISSSGAPDIFMAFLTCTAVMVLCKEPHARTWQQIALAGFLVGGIAGAKYTGCLIAAAFLIATAAEFRSLAQLALFTVASQLSGIWPYLRNFVWTGNPVFPFLSAKLSPHLVSAYALANLASDTGVSSLRDPLRLIPFIFLAAAQKKNPGLWDFFGPVVLALAPLILLALRNVRAWRVPILVWSLSSAGIFFASGLPRFLLPLFPIALSCAAAGFEAAFRQKWKMISMVATALIILMVLAGAAGLAIYSERPVLAALGVLPKTEYLEQSSQDYEVIEAVNKLLGGQQSKLRTLVFVRHLYYLDIPYLNGNPGTSFQVDPERLHATQAWKAFFEKNDIGYVVRSPSYPGAISQSLTEMERDGDLLPLAQEEVQNLQGKRTDQVLASIPVVVLKVKR